MRFSVGSHPEKRAEGRHDILLDVNLISAVLSDGCNGESKKYGRVNRFGWMNRSATHLQTQNAMQNFADVPGQPSLCSVSYTS